MSAQTLLQFVQKHCLRRGILQPASVIANPDETISQIQGLLEEELDELIQRGKWSQLETSLSFVHGNGPDYQAIGLDAAANAPTTANLVNFAIPMTLWNTNTNLPVAGPFSAVDWQAIINLQISVAQYNYRIYQNALYIYPYDPAAANFKFEYYSAAPILAPISFVPQTSFLSDSDIVRLPTAIVQAGLSWRWKREKGQAYAEEMRSYEAMVVNGLAAGTMPGQVSMDDVPNYERVISPGLLIPAGNYPVGP